MLAMSPAPTLAEPPKLQELDCATLTDADQRALAELGRSKLAETWLASGTGWLAAYDIGGDEKNPLLPHAKSEPSVTIRGFVFASGWTCALVPSADPNQALLKLRAITFRFNENGAGWTNPGSNGLVLSLLGKRSSGAWTATPVGADDTIFPQGTVLRRPALQDLPPHATWPAKPCRPPKLWTGQRCATPKSG